MGFHSLTIAAKHPFMSSDQNNNGIKDTAPKDTTQGHWVYKTPRSWQPFLQLSRLDRPIGYWLLALPGWIGLAFASLSHGLDVTDLKWAALILMGAVAMRGAGCTYNDIVDQDLDAQVDRTALRPLPAGTITTKQAWIWLCVQCSIGLIVLLCLPRLAQIISLCSLPLVAAYPFMKRITWWPQVWLGMTFNWAVLVAYAAKTGSVTTPLFILYAGLIFWTIGYDTIYACQDIEDDAFVGIKSTARRFGSRVKLGVGVCYGVCLALIIWAVMNEAMFEYFPTLEESLEKIKDHQSGWVIYPPSDISGRTERALLFPKYLSLIFLIPTAIHFIWQLWRFNPSKSMKSLNIFKSNLWLGLLTALSIFIYATLLNGI